MNKNPIPLRPCCAPSERVDRVMGGVSAVPRPRFDPTAAVDASSHMVVLDGGEFLMGSDAPDGYLADGEGPVHRVRLSLFRIDPDAVTNDRFAEFVAATGHVTDAERFG